MSIFAERAGTEHCSTVSNKRQMKIRDFNHSLSQERAVPRLRATGAELCPCVSYL